MVMSVGHMASGSDLSSQPDGLPRAAKDVSKRLLLSAAPKDHQSCCRGNCCWGTEQMIQRVHRCVLAAAALHVGAARR